MKVGSLPQTPTSTTPGSSYPSFQQHRPPSSHSASTPTSGHTQTPTFLRDSPQQSHAQVRGPYFPNPNPQYLSQPGTPLGPPTTFNRQGPSLRRESPGSQDHKRTNSGGIHGHQQQPIQSPINPPRNNSIPSPVAYAHSPTQQGITLSQDRERSLSVSPKTRLPSQPPLSTMAAGLDASQSFAEQPASAKRKIGDPRLDAPSPPQQPAAKRSMSLGVGGMLNVSQDNLEIQHDHSGVQYNKYAQVPSHRQVHQQDTQHISSAQPRDILSSSSAPGQGAMAPAYTSSPNQQVPSNPPLARGPAAPVLSTQPSHASQSPSQPPMSNDTPPTTSHSKGTYSKHLDPRTYSSQETASEPTVNNRIELSSAAKPRVRYREVPIFAQSFRTYGRRGRPADGRQQTIKKSPSIVSQQPQNMVSHPPKGEDTNGHGVLSKAGVQSQLDPAGILGPWEPSITNVIPAEELTREISNYLFSAVVQMNGVNFGPAGGIAGRGAMVEIEAKIGQIIDKNTNDRIRIPVVTECMLSRTDPNLRTAFRSSMTESQHRRLNGFLNQALKDSQPPIPGEPPKKPRVPLTYVHTRETDTFYDLSQNALNILPPSVHAYLDRRNKPKVRITTDQKTGKEMAKIIKVRVSDIEIYSPQTPFDWRVSVSLEVNYNGDMRDLVEATEGKDRRRPDRNKDRVSYKHSHYQIDLTQVKPAEYTKQTALKVEKEHELEIEISSAAVREQGQLVLQGQPNKYEDLIKGFVDNIRTLARFCKDH
ncbi:MAG: hypothetical protein Q9179_005834 [Wetmoreana sp. 5 TL-2023]